MFKLSLVRSVLTALLSLFCAVAQAAPRELSYEVLREEAHDPALFTQGLILEGDWLVESSGGYGKSLIRRYHVETGEVAKQVQLPQRVFAEGVVQVDNHLFLLTWRKGIGYELTADDLELVKRHDYDGEGWGLTYDGRYLVMSDGSDRLTWRQPDDFSKVRNLHVTGGGRSWNRLNELEYAQGLIWANVWQENVILAINPRNAQVEGILDLSALVEANSTRPSHSVLNGIAYDKTQAAFWITGKLWPRRYLLKINWPSSTSAGNHTEGNHTKGNHAKGNRTK